MKNSGHWINRLIVILLCLVMAGLLLAERARRIHTKEIAASIDSLGIENPNIGRLQEDIFDLFEDDNNFRLYTVTYDRSYFNRYYQGLERIKASVDTLYGNYISVAAGGAYGNNAMDSVFRRKTMINQMIADLKRMVDGALKAAVQVDTVRETGMKLPAYKTVSRERTRRADTSVVSRKLSRRRGFIGRVKALFSSGGDKDTIMIDRNAAINTERDSILARTGNAIHDAELFYRKHLHEQLAGRSMLDSRDRDLVLLNFSLMDSLNLMLHGFQQHQQQEEQEQKRRMEETTVRSTEQISLISGLSFVVIFLLLVLTLYNIYRVNRATKELLRAERSASMQTIAKSNLLASVSHEMRNPLTVIDGVTEMLGESRLSDPQKEQVRTIRAASGILLSTVNDILDLSKLEAGKMLVRPVAFQPEALVNEVYSIMRELAAQKGLLLILETKGLTPGLWVLGDGFRLKQVLLNLTGNAVKFTQHGSVTIRAFDDGIMAGAGRTDRSLAAADYVTVCFEVADTGIGIPQEKIPIVFNEFEQVQQEGSRVMGTGLGLAISQKIVQLHGGTIDVSSEVGKGSVFSVKINFDLAPPVRSSAEDGTDEKSRAGEDWIAEEGNDRSTVPLRPGSSEKELKGKRILLIEDNLMILELARAILEDMGVEVTGVDDGNDAWTRFQEGLYDMVITDIGLPGISGVEIAHMIRCFPDVQRAGVPVLALTGDALGYRDHAYEADFTGHIIKPFHKEDFLYAVQLSFGR